jgi:hypothetical protein
MPVNDKDLSRWRWNAPDRSGCGAAIIRVKYGFQQLLSFAARNDLPGVVDGDYRTLGRPQLRSVPNRDFRHNVESMLRAKSLAGFQIHFSRPHRSITSRYRPTVEQACQDRLPQSNWAHYPSALKQAADLAERV